jgi:hypothetical protein
MKTTMDLLKTDQVAEILRVKPDTLRQWRQVPHKGPRFIHMGRLVYYRRDAVEQFLNDLPDYGSTRPSVAMNGAK